jgi:CheY-like chemotaxis protein
MLGAGEKANILLVDDMPARLLTYEAILGSLDQNLVRAQSGEEALAKLLEMEVATILLDVSMPGMDGFETAAMIRGHPRSAQTPIIFVTGVHLTEIDRLRGYEMGAVDYVSVPVMPEILRGKVQVLVQLYLQRRELTRLNETMAEPMSNCWPRSPSASARRRVCRRRSSVRTTSLRFWRTSFATRSPRCTTACS